jgi:hypothetical protein
LAQLRADGLPVAGYGKYDLRHCVQWRTKKLVHAIKGTGSGAASGLRYAQKEKIELEIAKLRNQLIPAEVIEQVLSKVAALVSTQLEGLGPRLAAQIAALEDPVQVQQLLFVECRGIRSSMEQLFKTYADELDALSDNIPEDAEDAVTDDDADANAEAE